MSTTLEALKLDFKRLSADSFAKIPKMHKINSMTPDQAKEYGKALAYEAAAKKVSAAIFQGAKS